MIKDETYRQFSNIRFKQKYEGESIWISFQDRV
jgi:hypothetical protein